VLYPILSRRLLTGVLRICIAVPNPVSWLGSIFSSVSNPIAWLKLFFHCCTQSCQLTGFLIAVLYPFLSMCWIPTCRTVPITVYWLYIPKCSAVKSPVSLLDSLLQCCTQSCLFTGFLISVLYPVLSIDWIPYCSVAPSPIYWLDSLLQCCTQSCLLTRVLIAVLYPVLSIDWIPYCSAEPSPVYWLDSLLQCCTQSCLLTRFLIAVLYPVLSID
jgi:hypothetical protein